MSAQTSDTSEYSELILAAQTKLLKLRAQAKKRRLQAGLPVGRTLNSEINKKRSPLKWDEVVDQLPSHLGWGSHIASIALRGSSSKNLISRSQIEGSNISIDQSQNPLNQLKEEYLEIVDRSVNSVYSIPHTPDISSDHSQGSCDGRRSPNDSQDNHKPTDSSSNEPEAINIFGHTLDAIHQNKKDGTGRVWLLLRFMDKKKGEGRVLLRDARFRLTDPHSSLKCLSKKRLQQLIRAGEGIFWHKSKDGRHLHYHSESRLLAHFGLNTVRGFALEIPVCDLVKPIRHIRALFHDAFHSARQEGYGNPITRRVMQNRGMSDARTQRKYEALRGIHKRSEFAVVEKYSKEAWQRAQHEDVDERVGGPAFIFIDYKGILGKNPDRFKRPKGKRHWHNIFIIRQVGNAYAGSLKTAKRGRHWTSKKLRHLCISMQTLTGSAEEEGRPDTENLWFGKFYYESGQEIDRSFRKGISSTSGIDLRPRYCPQPGVDLDWNAGKKMIDRKLSGESFYWQEHFFIDLSGNIM